MRAVRRQRYQQKGGAAPAAPPPAMHFQPPLLPATLLRRERRFLAHMRLADGREVVAHCPNSGRMTGCATSGWAAYISHQPGPHRRLAYTWEMVHDGAGWIGINTHRTNALAWEALAAGTLAPLAGWAPVQREIVVGPHTRLDLLAERAGQRCYIEVKSVTLLGPGGELQFPDAVTVRGQKHLDTLAALAAAGHRAVLLFVVQRGDGAYLAPAAAIDPGYAAKLAAVAAAGVEVLAYRAAVDPTGLMLSAPVPVNIPPGGGV